MTFPTIRTKNDYQMLTDTGVRLRYGAPHLVFEDGEPTHQHARALYFQWKAMPSKFRAIADSHWRIQDDKTMTEAARLMRSATVGKRVVDQERKAFVALADTAMNAADEIKKQLAVHLQPSANVGQALIDGELRSMVRTTPNPIEQMKLVKDPAVRAACARSPRVLSGLGEDVYASVRDEHLASVAPEAMSHFKEIEAATKGAEAALSRLEDDAASMIDFQSAAAIEGKRYEPIAA